MCQEYNGWVNRETWAAALWLNNAYYYDDGMQFRELAVSEARLDVAEWASDLESRARSLWSYYVAESLESLYGYDSDLWRIPAIVNNSMVGDLLLVAFARVNWCDIADGIVADLILDNPDWLTIDGDGDGALS